MRRPAGIKLKNRSKSAPIPWLADLPGVEPQYVEKPKVERCVDDDMLTYLEHAEYADKREYASWK